MAVETTKSGLELSKAKIASYALQDPRYPEIELAQVSHRIRLVRAWAISPGSRILEIGCGQGNCTTVLAEAVGPSGKVDAVDPAPGDYGAPFTLAQAQGHISTSEIGHRIAWHRADPVAFINSNTDTWDYVVLSHCIWYFKSPETLSTILKSLKGRANNICIAEYALHASIPQSIPHLLATFARAAFEAHRDSTHNIQSPLSPTGIKEIALAQGFALHNESTIVPEPELSDGRWEVGDVVHPTYLKEVEDTIKDERVALLLRSLRDSTISACETIEGAKKAQTMDVWNGIFTSDTSRA